MRVFVMGTRPEIIKFAPLIGKIPATIIHTGQHRELAQQAFKMFGFKPDVDFNLMTEKQEVKDFVIKCLIFLNEYFKNHDVDEVWVQGDTMSAFCGAFAGWLNGIKVIHLEAGMRSGNLKAPYPEEMMRVIISKLASVHLCPLERQKRNLAKEGIRDNVYVVGNTIVDALKSMDISDKRPIKEKYVLATIHRREARLATIFSQLKQIPNLVFPCHPNPVIRKMAKGIGLKVQEPMDYKTILWYMKHAELVITDSGGIQEEAGSFGTPVLIIREYTERPETIGELAGFKGILKGYKKWYGKKFHPKNPFGDGNAVEKICQKLKIQKI